MDIKNCLAELRKEAGYNQKQFAEFVGIPRSNICQFESGKRVPRLEIAFRIADALHRNPCYIWWTD